MSLTIGYSQLLASSDVRRLVVGSMVARLPSAMLPLAILLLVHQQTGSLGLAGLTVGAFGLGRAVVSPVAGSLVDRMGQVRVLGVGAGLQALLLAGVVFVAGAPLVVVVVTALFAGASTPPVQASLRALWPVVAGTQPAREAAYAFDATSQELIWIAGPLLVAVLLAVASPAAIVISSGLIGCVGVALFVSSPTSFGWRGDGRRAQWMHALAVPDLRLLAVAGACTGFSWGALTFGLTGLAVGLGSSRWAGALLACVSIGSIAGGLIYGARRWRVSVLARYRALLLVNIAFSLPLLFARSVLAAVPMSLLAGLPLAPIYGSSYVMTGRVATPGTTTEAFTWTSSAFALGVALGTAAGGAAVQAVDVHAAFGLACAGSAAAWLIARRLDGAHI